MSVMHDADLIANNTKQHQALAREFASLTREHFGARVGRIVLYGSTARGDCTLNSDIDVLVTLDAVSDADSEWLVSKAFSLGVMGSGVVLQPIFMPDDRFVEMQDRELRFAMDITSEGISL